MKNKLNSIWKKLEENPKKTYKYSLIILVISFLFFGVEVFLLPPKEATITNIPTLLGKSDQYINEQNIKQKERVQKISTIMKELDDLKEKEVLLKNDSIRIEYLLIQYQKLKNEKENSKD